MNVVKNRYFSIWKLIKLFTHDQRKHVGEIVKIMAVNVVGKFSPNGELYAYYSPDGVLKVWKSISGDLIHEFIPTAHLSAVFTCLSWSTTKSQNCQEV